MRPWIVLTLLLLASLAGAAPINWRGAIYRGRYSERPAIKDTAPAALYVATDCAGDPCTAGGARTPCIFQDDGSAWQQVLCGTTSTTTTTTTTLATTTTAVSTTTTTVASTTTTT